MSDHEKFDHEPATDASRLQIAWESNRHLRGVLQELNDMAKLAGYEDAHQALSYLPVTRLTDRPRNEREQP